MIDIELLDYMQAYLTPKRKNLFQEKLALRTNHFTVVTEDVYQLHNTSAVIRSCDVFGVQNVHVVEEKNIKRIDREIAMGAQKWVHVNRHTSVTQCITHLRDANYQIIATTPHNDACLLHDFDITKPAALFFGTERDGLSDEVLSKADGFLKVPMVGFTESLNISVSAAIILQSLTTRLRQSNLSWQLTEEDRRFTLLQWLKNTIKSSEEIIARFETKI